MEVDNIIKRRQGAESVLSERKRLRTSGCEYKTYRRLVVSAKKPHLKM